MSGSMTLGQHLAAIAAETGMAGAGGGGAFRALCAALANDPVLTDRARVMLASMDERVLMRDHVSRWQKTVLESAIAGGA